MCCRPYWRCYYANTDAVIYVVDSADRDRMGISKSELYAMLEVCACVCACVLCMCSCASLCFPIFTFTPLLPSPLLPSPFL